MKIITTLSLLTLPFCCAAQSIITLAGTGKYGIAVAGSVAAASEIGEIHGITVDDNRNVYIASSVPDQRILKIDTSGIITIFAGNGILGYSGDGGAATDAALNYPTSIVFDRSGNAYIADDGNQRIRKVTPGGIISTIAGDGTAGNSGNNGPATAARLSAPVAVAVDDKDNVYIAEQGNNVVRKINSAGIITNFAGNGSWDFYGDGGPATSAAFSDPNRLAISASGDVYINDFANYRIRKVDASGIVTTFAGNGSLAQGADGGKAWDTPLAPYGLTCDKKGNVYIADFGTCTIRIINASGVVGTAAGNNMCGYKGECIDPKLAGLFGPDAVAIDNNGTIYIADRNNYRIRAVGNVCHNLAIENAEHEGHSIAVYPDPANTLISVSSSFKINTIRIINYMGQTVFAGVYGKTTVSIDIKDFAAGIYLIKVNDLEIKRFVKQ